MRVAARVADHARSVDLEVGHAVRMAVDPERDAVAVHQRGQVAGEGAEQRPVHRRGRPDAHEWGVMGDHDGRPVEGDREPFGEPAAARLVQRARVVGPEPAPLLAPGDDLVVVEQAGADRHGTLPLRCAGGQEVAPQGAAEKAHAVEHQLVVLEHVHRAVHHRRAQLAGQRRKRVAVVLVVAGHEEHGPAVRPPARQPHARRPQADVAREHDGIGVDHRELEGAELDVEVADDVQAHEPWRATRSRP